QRTTFCQKKASRCPWIARDFRRALLNGLWPSCPEDGREQLPGICSPVANDILTFYVFHQEYLIMTKQQIVIIGGSEGIGLAVAKAARALGARVLAVSRTRAKLEAARGVVSGLEIRVADINNTASIQELFSEFSAVDHVYIAAGSSKLGGPLDHPLSDFRHKFDERLWGWIDVVRAAHRLMRPGGSFTFTGGLSSDRPVSGAWVSGIATMATEQLARVLALELAPIRFNAIAPGYTDTPMWDHIFPENRAQALSDATNKYPIPRPVTADEVAQPEMLLMQNEALTGETIHIDCGARLV